MPLPQDQMDMGGETHGGGNPTEPCYTAYNKGWRERKGGRREGFRPEPYKRPKGQGKGNKGSGRGPPPALSHKGGKKTQTKALRSVDLCLLTWNVDGFRNQDRRMIIASCLWKWEVDIAILTESHLWDEDIFFDPPGSSGEESKRIYKIKMGNYYIANWHNRDSSDVPIGGGVLILARNGVVTRKIAQTNLPERPLSCCAIVVEAVEGCSDPFRVTGVYFPPPPTAHMTARLAEPITRSDFQEQEGTETLNHIICGDFNPTSWGTNLPSGYAPRGLGNSQIQESRPSRGEVLSINSSYSRGQRCSRPYSLLRRAVC